VSVKKSYLPTSVVGFNSGAEIWSNVPNALTCNNLYASVYTYNQNPYMVASGFNVSDSVLKVTNFEVLVKAVSDNDVNIELAVYLKVQIFGVWTTIFFAFIYPITTIATTFSFSNPAWIRPANWNFADLSTLKVELYPYNTQTDDATTLFAVDCITLNVESEEKKIVVTLPTGMSLKDWADQISLDLDPFGTFGRLDDESKWQDWAVQFSSRASLSENFPTPYNFSNWRDWAERFCQVVE